MPTDEMLPTNLAANVAVQTVELRHIKESLERIELQLGSHVTRNEWEMRNGYVDGQFVQTSADIAAARATVAELRRDVEAKRAPWWAVGSLLVAGISLAWVILGPVIVAR